MKPDDDSRYFPSRRPPRSRSSREERSPVSFDDANLQSSRKGADSNVDDAWNKIASELERIDSFGSEYDDFENWGVRPSKSVDKSNRSSQTFDDAPVVNESARDSLRRANALSNDSQASYNEDKLSEDYETRNKRRANSVWDSGGWRSYSNEGTTCKRSSSYARAPRRSSTNYDSYRPSDASENTGGNKRQNDNFVNPPRNSNFTSRRDGRRDASENRRFQSERTSSRRFGSERDSSYRGGDSRRNDTGYVSERTRRFNDERFEDPNFDRSYRQSGSFSSERDNFRRDRNSRRRFESKPTPGAFGRYGEPLSLAEEYAERYGRRNESKNTNDFNDTYEKFPVNQPENSSFETNSAENADLQGMSIYELIDEARRLDGDPRGAHVKRVLHERVVQAGLMIAAGTLEILPDGFGFLRSVETNYLSCADDIYVSPSQIRRFNLRNGLVVSGLIRPPKERERYFALLRIDTINGQAPNSLASTPCFDDLVAARPIERFKFEREAENVENPGASAFDASTESTFNEAVEASKGGDMRLLDLVLPFGFGQRALVVCPPRSGKTPLIRKMVESTLANYDDAFVFVVLVKKRPEDLTEARRVLTNERCEIVGTTFDELDARHIQIALMVFEKAKRMVEYGKKVVVFVDSLTRLVSAWRGEDPNEQNMTAALQFVRKLFGSSRKIDGGGSLTVVATSLRDEDSPETQAELEALQSVSHATLWLDSDLASKNVWPPINVVKSATRDYKDFVSEEERILLEKVRITIQDKEPTNAIRELLDKIAQTSNNRELQSALDGDSQKKNDDAQ